MGVAATTAVYHLAVFTHALYADHRVQDIAPHGATAAYAAPEVLHSLEVHCRAGSSGADTALINGPSADWWSVGVVLYD